MNIRKTGCCLNSLALIVGLIACGNDISETIPSTQAGQQNQASVQTPSDPQLAAFSGKVVEKQDASIYTYVRLDDGAGNKIWAAVPKTQLEIHYDEHKENRLLFKQFSFNRWIDRMRK